MPKQARTTTKAPSTTFESDKVETRRRGIVEALVKEVAGKDNAEAMARAIAQKLAPLLSPPADLPGAVALRNALVGAMRRTPACIGALIDAGEKVTSAQQVTKMECDRNPALRSQREAAIAAYYNRSTALSDTLKAYCPNCSRSKDDLVDHARYFRGEAGKMGAKALANATAYVQCLSNPSCPERVLTA